MASGNPAALSDARPPIVEIRDSDFLSPDLAPTPSTQRRWRIRDFAALWISMSACIPTYMLASSLIDEGMNWWQAVLTIFLGNLIVLVPMVMNAHAGTKYGISFPVYCRAAFGLRGANVPALLRALVACGWFGIQTWIGGAAIYTIGAIFVPSWAELPKSIAGINAAQLACFLLFWAINVLVIFRGIDTIRFLLNIKAPLLIALGLLLLGWAYQAAGGFGPILSQPSKFVPGGPRAGQFWLYFFPLLTANVGFWATLSLNIPDFSRYARSQRDQVIGQALGLPTTMGLFAFIGVAVTSATIIIYPGEGPIWDPVVLLAKFQDPAVLIIAMLSIVLATLATNIAANVVSPANDFAHLWPRAISFRTGGLITALIGVLMMPWKLVEDPSGYIFKWLIAYSALLGSVGGVLIADYFLLRRTRLDLPDLYARNGRYWYAAGVNGRAIIALVAGISPCVPGFLGTVKLATPNAALRPWEFRLVDTAVPTFSPRTGVAGPAPATAPAPTTGRVLEISTVWLRLYDYAWFLSFGVAALVYLFLMLALPPRSTRPAADAL